MPHLAAAGIYKPPLAHRAEATLIVAANTDNESITLRLFHDDDGITFTDATCIFIKVLDAFTSVVVYQSQCPASGPLLQNESSSLGALASAPGITLTVYGVVLPRRGVDFAAVGAIR
ncbi:MAG: hypothetical protein HC923_02945 [Myxococcales bacterium]|nr:hypothetical protein [Myxococcales bacterium]